MTVTPDNSPAPVSTDPSPHEFDPTITVFNEDDGTQFFLAGPSESLVGDLIAQMYSTLQRERQPDDRLRCECNGSDVFSHAPTTFGQYIETQKCPCLTWLFAGATGGAACR